MIACIHHVSGAIAIPAITLLGLAVFFGMMWRQERAERIRREADCADLQEDLEQTRELEPFYGWRN